MRKKLQTFGLLFLLCGTLAATDAEANAALEQAAQKMKDKTYTAAGQKYLDAELLADSPVLKANALIGATLAYRNAKQYGKEFDCIEKLLKKHMNQIDYKRAVTREYEIADDFFDGHRDAAVSWLPFIKDADRTVEFYEAALRNASCAEQAPDARLRLGGIYLRDQKPLKAVEIFKEILQIHPESSAARFARMELAHTYVQLAESGDGDGAWARQAITALQEFLEKHPNDPEAPWAKMELNKINTIDAKRTHALAEYYHRIGRDDLAERYLAQVIRDHGATPDSIQSEKLLAKIDKTYTPPPEKSPRVEKYVHTFPRSTIPLERNPIMTVPENSGGKWLLPIRNLKPDITIDAKDAPIERQVDKHEF